MGKMKPLDASQLPDLLPGDGWERLQGLKDAVPKEIRSIPDQKFYHATVSGSLDSPRTETKYGVSGDVVAGVDVWRFDEKDAERHGINFNKEHYFITRTGAAPEYAYWLHGPFTEEEMDHWREQIPDEYAECDLLASRRKFT
jgi:hypothetical protein